MWLDISTTSAVSCWARLSSFQSPSCPVFTQDPDNRESCRANGPNIRVLQLQLLQKKKVFFPLLIRRMCQLWDSLEVYQIIFILWWSRCKIRTLDTSESERPWPSPIVHLGHTLKEVSEKMLLSSINSIWFCEHLHWFSTKKIKWRTPPMLPV